ncbi:hypothetical protein M1N05_03120 [Dehalococcoidales bacterium]|nr:hypothetical protein [Dehalococcoidales bacterium]
MHLVITGQTGLKKARFFHKIKEMADSSGKPLEIYHLEEVVKEECRTLSPFYLDSYFQKRDDFVERHQNAFRKVLDKINQERPVNAILDTHAVYRRSGVPFHVLDYQLLREFNPDMFITLIDDIYKIQKQIREHPASKIDKATAEITLKDILDWRSEEIMATETMANFMKSIRSRTCPHFIIPIKGHEEVVYQLLFESKEALGSRGQWKPKVYIGFPITKALDDPHLREERDNFRQQMKSSDLGLIVFDPYGIEERALVKALEDTLKQLTLPDTITVISEQGEQFEIDRKEAELVCQKDIQLHVATRDYRLISQSDFFAGFRPAMSPGEQREIPNAHQLGKPVYVVWPSTDPPKDDFLKLAITEERTTTNELIFLIKQYIIPFMRGGS